MDLDVMINRSIRHGLTKQSERTAAKEEAALELVSVEADEKEKEEIIESINDVRREWKDIILNFEYAEDEKLVDYYTFRMKACESRYAYFLAKAKELGITEPNCPKCNN